MERGREIFFSLNILKEKVPPSLRRYAEKGRGGNSIKENRFLISPGAAWYHAVGFSGSRLLSTFFLPFLFLSRVLHIFLLLASEEYGDARDAQRVQCPSRACGYVCVYVCCACMHERNVDHCTIGCVNSVQGSGNHATRDSPIPLVRMIGSRG